jgi:hypothetical protein
MSTPEVEPSTALAQADRNETLGKDGGYPNSDGVVAGEEYLQTKFWMDKYGMNEENSKESDSKKTPMGQNQPEVSFMNETRIDNTMGEAILKHEFRDCQSGHQMTARRGRGRKNSSCTSSFPDLNQTGVRESHLHALVPKQRKQSSFNIYDIDRRDSISTTATHSNVNFIFPFLI